MSIRLAFPSHGRFPKFRQIGYFGVIEAGGNSKGPGMRSVADVTTRQSQRKKRASESSQLGNPYTQLRSGLLDGCWQRLLLLPHS